MSVRAGRVRVRETFPRERVVLGELHLLRSRLDGVLDEIGTVLRQPEVDEEAWPRVEEAARLARPALVAAVGAVPALPAAIPAPGLLRVGELRVDPASGRQWYGEAEFELTPLHHRLLAVMAAEPCRVFGKDELAAEVWRRPGRAEAVKVSGSRLRRARVAANAPGDRFEAPGHYRLDLRAPAELQERLRALQEELRRLHDGQQTLEEIATVRERRGELTAALGRTERAFEEAVRDLGVASTE